MARRSSDSPSLSRRLTIAAPDFSWETVRFGRGDRLVAGVDEAGRGPLAGPVVAAAVVLDQSAIPAGLNDSKKLGAADRERLFVEILGTATVSVASASAGEIDRLNIRAATLLAMRRAVAGLALHDLALNDLALGETARDRRAGRPCHALIDGRDVPPGLLCPATAVVQGDARSLSIAAASIVAKVTRDRIMARLCERFPAYGFGQHMGYGTKQHLGALARHGPCAFHRMTFSPIRQARLDFA